MSLSHRQRQIATQRELAFQSWCRNLRRNGVYNGYSLLAKAIHDSFVGMAQNFGYQDARAAYPEIALRDVDKLRDKILWDTRTDEIDWDMPTFVYLFETIDRAYRDAYFNFINDMEESEAV